MSGVRPGFPEHGSDADFRSEVERRLAALERQNSIAPFVATVNDLVTGGDLTNPVTWTAELTMPEWVTTVSVFAVLTAAIVNGDSAGGEGSIVIEGDAGVELVYIAQPGSGFANLHAPFPLSHSADVVVSGPVTVVATITEDWFSIDASSVTGQLTVVFIATE